MPTHNGVKYVILEDDGSFFYNIIETNYSEYGFGSEIEAEIAAKDYIESNFGNIEDT